jgi:hypothetical protein
MTNLAVTSADRQERRRETRIHHLDIAVWIMAVSSVIDLFLTLMEKLK